MKLSILNVLCILAVSTGAQGQDFLGGAAQRAMDYISGGSSTKSSTSTRPVTSNRDDEYKVQKKLVPLGALSEEVVGALLIKAGADMVTYGKVKRAVRVAQADIKKFNKLGTVEEIQTKINGLRAQLARANPFTAPMLKSQIAKQEKLLKKAVPAAEKMAMIKLANEQIDVNNAKLRKLRDAALMKKFRRGVAAVAVISGGWLVYDGAHDIYEWANTDPEPKLITGVKAAALLSGIGDGK